MTWPTASQPRSAVAEGGLDGALASRHAGVDDGRLGAAHDDVGGDEAEVDPEIFSEVGRWSRGDRWSWSRRSG